MSLIDRFPLWLLRRCGWRLVYNGTRTATDGLTIIRTVQFDRSEGL